MAMLGDLEKAKSKAKKALDLSRSIGGEIEKEAVFLSQRFDELMQSTLKLEQETREI